MEKLFPPSGKKLPTLIDYHVVNGNLSGWAVFCQKVEKKFSMVKKTGKKYFLLPADFCRQK